MEIYFIIGGIVLFLLLIILIVVLKSKKKKPKIKIDQKYIEDLIAKFGGKNNISKIEVDQNKLKVDVINRKIVNLEGIKEMASSGVFMTNNTIKTLFKYDSLALKEELKKYKGE